MTWDYIWYGSYPQTEIAAVQPDKVVSNLASKITLKKGQKVQMKGSTPTFTCTMKPSYTSGKKSVATVNKKGWITAKKKGKAKITCRIGKKKAYCTVTVQ